MSVLVANAGDGIKGLGFRFVENTDWVTPNPVWLPGIYEAFYPPNYPDMRAVVEVFVNIKFGKNGAYYPNTSGPWTAATG